jgi:hypothetical protein
LRPALPCGAILTSLALAACGGGSISTVEESSGYPPVASNLKGLVEQQIRKENDVSSVDCREAPKPAVGLSSLIWDCAVTTEPSGRPVEIEILSGVSDGRYEMLECRTSPNQPYRQTPRGVCRDIH